MYQQLTLLGFTGNDASMRYTPSGTAVANFSLAVNNRYTNAAGEPVDEVTWFRITTWNRMAETAGEYIRKGQFLLIVGALKPPHTWIDDQGQAQASLEVTARTIRFLPGGQRNDKATDGMEIVDDGVAAE